jgi:REP element-mobilizing transposase RayT
MARPPRLEYPGALYHVTSRGVQRNAIFVDERDRSALVTQIARALTTAEARAFAYCLMGNHYHLVIETGKANLSALMHSINAVYSQAFNRRHDRHGHLLEGRFQALHVDRDNYLLEVCRYVDLNPVRANMVTAAGHWKWSSYRAHTGDVPAPRWLATARLHAMLTDSLPGTDVDVEAARRRYAEWVYAGHNVRLWSQSPQHGLYLGDSEFVERVKRGAG